MKNLTLVMVFFWVSINTEAQNNTNPNGGSTPVSNPTLQSATSNSNNSNSGVNANGNPGTILNSSSNSSSGGFKTPTPPLEPGTRLNSTGTNEVIPVPANPNNSGNINKTGTPPVQPVVPVNNSAIPTRAELDKNAHIDSMVRAIDRRREMAVKNKPRKLKQPSKLKKAQ